MARVAIDEAEQQLQERPRHWAWMFVGLIRAVWAAQDGDEPTCRAWWAVAKERGVGRIRSRDMEMPLRQLVAATKKQGWGDITVRAESFLASLREG
jgi:hypothetical protein